MFIKDLIGRSIGGWSGAEEECECGSKHKLDTLFFVGSGAEESVTDFMSPLAPPGCGVVLVKETERDTDELSRKLRRAGYTVYERELTRGDGYVALEREKPKDSVRAVLGVGGGFTADCAKYISAFSSLPCGIVVRTHASPSFLVPSAAIDGGGVPRLFKTGAPKVVVCDTERLPSAGNINAAAFGEIASRLIALYDWKFAATVRGEKLCEKIYDAALGEVDSLLRALRVTTRRNKEISTLLLESGLKVSALAALEGTSRLYSGGDTACTLAFEMLMKYEGGRSKLWGENEFLFSMLLSDIYPKVFDARNKVGFLPPPDNNMRLEKLVEYLGIDERVAAASVTPYLTEKVSALCDYRLGEYEDELKGELEMLSYRLNEAYRIFRRLYSDDGFSLRGYLGVGEARISIALAPEMRNKYTALTHLKNMGVLDAYLLD